MTSDHGPNVPRAMWVTLGARHSLASVAVLMLGFALLIRLSLHNLAFWGDCWFVLSRPYFLEPWEAIKSHALRFGRPGEVLYYIPMFQLAGFNARAWLLVSFFWLAAASLLSGYCLRRSFPNLTLLHVGVPLLVFFSASLGPLVYRMDLDQGRLCLMFFWLSAACYQSFLLRRARGFGRGGVWLVGAGAAGVYSLLCYEATLLLSAGIAVLLVPLWLRLQRALRLRSLVEIFVTMAFVPAVYLAMRFGLFEGGKDDPLRYFPRIGGFPEAVWNAAGFLVAPLRHIHWDAATVLVLFLLLGAIGYIVLNAVRYEGSPDSVASLRGQAQVALLLGVVLFAAGISPFLLGKYTYTRVDFAGQSRIFAAAWYGLAIVLLAAMSFARTPVLRRIAAGVVTVIAAGGGTLIYDLHRDWETAGDINARMWRDFFRQVPEVTEKSFFVFKDLYCGIRVAGDDGYRAVVNSGANGIQEFVKIAYDDQQLRACYLNTTFPRADNPLFRIAFTGEPARLRLPGDAPGRAFPADRYILVERNGYTLNVADEWTQESAGPGVDWQDGATRIQTNRRRIRPLTEGDTRTPERRVRQLGFILPAENVVIREVDLQ